MASLGNGLYHDPSIPRPRSAMYFRDAREWYPPISDPNQNLSLVSYATAPEPYHHAQNGLAASFYQDPAANQMQQQGVPTSNAYLDPSNYPGDLAMSHELAGRDRSILGEIIKTGKVPINPVLQPIYDAGKTVIETAAKAVVILASPYVGLYITDVYLKPMENQLNQAGRAKRLPQWLKDFCRPHYSNINLDSIRYGEDIQMMTIQPATAMKIGYDIYFPCPIDLELINLPTAGWDQQRERLKYFTQSVAWILHEMEHTVQFYKAGGEKHLWVIKYVAQTGMFLKLGPSDDSHDAIQLERDADAKAWSLYSEALKYFSRSRPTTPGTLYRGVVLKPASATDVARGLGEGSGLVSQDGRFVLRVQSDGNIVIYAPDNLPIWKSNSAGKACPPYWLVCTPERDSMKLQGYTFKADSIEPILTTIWQTVEYRVPPIPGVYYFVDPTWSLIQQCQYLHIVLTDAGELQSQLKFADGRPDVVTWKTGAHPITTQVIESTATTLPAAHPTSSFAFDPRVQFGF